MPSNHLILYHPLILLPSIFPSIRILSNESALCIRWPKYCSLSFSISPSNEHPGLISFRMDWLDLRAVQRIVYYIYRAGQNVCFFRKMALAVLLTSFETVYLDCIVTVVISACIKKKIKTDEFLQSHFNIKDGIKRQHFQHIMLYYFKKEKTPLRTHSISHSTFSTHCINSSLCFSCAFPFLK